MNQLQGLDAPTYAQQSHRPNPVTCSMRQGPQNSRIPNLQNENLDMLYAGMGDTDDNDDDVELAGGIHDEHDDDSDESTYNNNSDNLHNDNSNDNNNHDDSSNNGDSYNDDNMNSNEDKDICNQDSADSHTVNDETTEPIVTPGVNGVDDNAGADSNATVKSPGAPHQMMMMMTHPVIRISCKAPNFE
jgi:hypothetical protein